MGLCALALVMAPALPVEAAGRDGDRTINTLEVVNHYAELARDAAPGNGTLQVTDLAMLPGLEVGDLLFLIQMQGAWLDTPPDTVRYGAVLEERSAGRYEWVEVTGVDVATHSLRVRGRGPGSGLRSSYTASGHTQVIRVPRFKTLTIGAQGVLTAPDWNGRTGGVVVVTADTLRVDGRITAGGKGFRGGQVRMGGSASEGGFRSTDVLRAAERGEGLGGGASAYDATTGRYGRGAAANGGGGGNARGAAGGGGANGLAPGKTWTGLGVMDVSTEDLQAAWRLDPAYILADNRFADDAGGGRGGHGCSAAEEDPRVTAPEDPRWGCGNRAPVGGLGGRPLSADVRERLFFGGGGGAGHSEELDAGAGGDGGGLVFVLARTLQGQGRIEADGAAGGSAGLKGRRGGPGGGGGGGTVVLMATEGISEVEVSAIGGQGGTQRAVEGSHEASGGGGGGGGGVVAILGGSQARVLVTGGHAGTTTQPLFDKTPVNGATSGGDGSVRLLPGFGPDFPPPALTVDLQVSLDVGQRLEPDYLSVPVYATVTNSGPEAAEDVTVAIELPAYLSGSAVPGEYSCGPSGSTVTCTLPRLDAGASTVIEMDFFLPPSPLEAFPISASATGGGFDLVPENNQTTISTNAYGRLRLTGGSCSSADGQGSALSALGFLLPLLCSWRPRARRSQRAAGSGGVQSKPAKTRKPGVP
jgi:hypothetical protein